MDEGRCADVRRASCLRMDQEGIILQPKKCSFMHILNCKKLETLLVILHLVSCHCFRSLSIKREIKNRMTRLVSNTQSMRDKFKISVSHTNQTEYFYFLCYILNRMTRLVSSTQSMKKGTEDWINNSRYTSVFAFIILVCSEYTYMAGLQRKGKQ